MFPAGVSGNFKLMKLPAYGSPDYLGGLIGYIPDQANLGEWGPLLFASAGGVSLSIQGEAEPRIGTVTQKVVKSNTFADGSVIAAEKWTLTFDDGTLEVSSNHGKDGMGLCVGTKGTGYFEGAKFSGTYVATMTPYDLTPFGMEGTAIFKVQLGTGELMLKP